MIDLHRFDRRIYYVRAINRHDRGSISCCHSAVIADNLMEAVALHMARHPKSEVHQVNSGQDVSSILMHEAILPKVEP